MKKYIIIWAVAVLAATSCADQLDQEPANAITTEQIREILASDDEAKIDLIIGGIANNIPFAIHTITVGGADVRTNSPLNMQYYNSLLGYDIVCNPVSGYGYESYSAYNSRRSSVAGHNIPYWQYGWSCVVAANKLLSYLPEVLSTGKVKDYKARALTLRAYGYNFLMENYRGTYQSSGEGLMIYDKMGEGGAYKGYSTAGETYDFIKADLTEAVRLFAESGIGEGSDGYTIANTQDVDLGVANFLLARVSLLTGDYAAAIAACNSVLAKYPVFIPTAHYGGQNTGDPPGVDGAVPDFAAENNAFLNFTDNPEVIFGFPGIDRRDAAANRGYTNVAAEWLNVFGSGYGGSGSNYGRIVSTLYAAINANDVRKGVFLSGSEQFLNYVHQFSTPATRTIPAYSNLKWAATSVGGLKTENDITKFDVCYMRSSEVLLMKAEAQALSGGSGENDAKTTLNTLLAARTNTGSPALTCDTYYTGGTSVFDMVKLQWRIEMWGENGLEYYNNKRWNNPAVRTRASGHDADVTIGVDLMTLEIPADESLYNPNI
ncbi:MAG: RagB/SusD family nutrient uptake outer membrane protein [Bacteroidales bacterium]|jgi:hypothetical protein|nr:RagB/SusD family nutrient uptake outer membrane protein [Bacteroidales bacterium]